MQVTAHFRHPTGMAYPDRDWIMNHITERLGFSLTVPEYNKVKRDAVLTEEISDTLPAQITYTIDHEETEIDPDSGLEQDIITYNSVSYP